MESIQTAVASAVNTHSRLTRSSLFTPYQAYCFHVHKLTTDPITKWGLLQQWNVDPQDYDNPTIFSSDWQLSKLLSKFSPGETVGETEENAAYRKFQMAESRCEAVNEHFDEVFRRPKANRILRRARNIISSSLGPIKDFFIQEVQAASYREVEKGSSEYRDRPSNHQHKTPEAPCFGPGVSVGACDTKLRTPSEKIVLGTCTPRSAYVIADYGRAYKIAPPTLVAGSVLTFVPKRVGEARTICFEPSMNMVVQKRVGSYFKKRLKAALKIDLGDQTKNRQLARLGSLTNSYATIDLSAASDLLSYRLICELLPYEWFRYLDDIRSHFYKDIDGKWKRFHKFSTMGNGFTFELETLVFAAVVLAAIREESGETLQVAERAFYGDDIIVPTRHADTAMQALQLIGHIPNYEKTFTRGPFRESCGGDFFNGICVTPLKIKDFNNDQISNLISSFNFCVCAYRDPDHTGYYSPWYLETGKYLASRIYQLSNLASVGPVPWRTSIHDVRDHFLYNDPDFDVGWFTSSLYWNKNTMSLQPRRVYIRRETYFSTLRRVNPDSRYDCSNTSAPYCIEHGYDGRLIAEVKYGWVRNRFH